MTEFFFFSSRRRHTRFSRDWSSDVCSSDLQVLANSLLYFLAGSVGSAQQYYFIQSSNHQNKWLNYLSKEDHRKITDSHQNEFSLFFKDDWKITPRSEERRVGKECRSQ